MSTARMRQLGRSLDVMIRLSGGEEGVRTTLNLDARCGSGTSEQNPKCSSSQPNKTEIKQEDRDGTDFIFRLSMYSGTMSSSTHHHGYPFSSRNPPSLLPTSSQDDTVQGMMQPRPAKVPKGETRTPPNDMPPS